MIQKDNFVTGKDTEGLKFICAKVVDMFNEFATVHIFENDSILRCRLDDLETI